MRVVVDTNVWISALLQSASLPAQVIGVVAEKGVLLCSDETIAEFEDVTTRPKWRHLQAQLEVLRSILHRRTRTLVLSRVTDCRDPHDNKFLALALDGAADYIVTGDEDLLVLNPWRGVPILRPADFLLAVAPAAG